MELDLKKEIYDYIDEFFNNNYGKKFKYEIYD